MRIDPELRALIESVLRSCRDARVSDFVNGALRRAANKR